MKQEAKHLAPPEKGRTRAPLIIVIVLAVLAAAYLGFCAWVQQSDTFWRGVIILGQDVTCLLYTSIPAQSSKRRR